MTVNAVSLTPTPSVYDHDSYVILMYDGFKKRTDIVKKPNAPSFFHTFEDIFIENPGLAQVSLFFKERGFFGFKKEIGRALLKVSAFSFLETGDSSIATDIPLIDVDSESTVGLISMVLKYTPLFGDTLEEHISLNKDNIRNNRSSFTPVPKVVASTPKKMASKVKLAQLSAEKGKSKLS